MHTRDASFYANTMGHSVKRLYHLMDQRFNEQLRPHGLARSQWYALFHIHIVGTTTQKELQKVLTIEAATLTVMIDTLVRKGWLKRTQGAADRRIKELSFTPEGLKRWEELPDPILAVRGQMLADISTEDEKTAREILDRAIKNLEQ